MADDSPPTMAGGDDSLDEDMAAFFGRSDLCVCVCVYVRVCVCVCVWCV